MESAVGSSVDVSYLVEVLVDVSYLVLRGTIVNRAYGKHKNLHI